VFSAPPSRTGISILRDKSARDSARQSSNAAIPKRKTKMTKIFTVLAAALTGALVCGSALAQSNTAAMADDHKSTGAMSSGAMSSDSMPANHMAADKMAAHKMKAKAKKGAVTSGAMSHDKMSSDKMSTGAMTSPEH
jgi:pentapeptide MXKDX repeat protein